MDSVTWAAAAVLLLSMSAASAQTVINATAAPSPNLAGGLNASGATRNTTTAAASPISVDQTVPAFTGIRSCVPFNVLISPPLDPTSPTGRILVQADDAVLNSTAIAVEDGVLSLSLTGSFESRRPINFTIFTPGASKLRSIVNRGSGLVVLGPGHKLNSIRLVAPSVGQIVASNLTAESVTLQSSGVLRSAISGALDRVNISSSGTGSVAVSSSTPTQLAVDLSGITTVLADIPQGSSITGSAGGLSKVQHTAGSCELASDTQQLFPSIFGSPSFGLGDSGINSKCQQVAAAALQPLAAALGNPQWTCGVIVDGQHICQGANATVIPWNITEGSAIAAATASATNASAAPRPTAANATDTGAGTAAPADWWLPWPPRPTGGARKRMLLQGPNSDTVRTTVTTAPSGGQIGTGAVTSGPGTFASGTGSVSGPGGTTTQTTSSERGQPPQTELSTGGVGSTLFNPLFIPIIPASDIINPTNATDTSAAGAMPDATQPTTTTSTATAGGGSPAVATTRSGSESSTGVAVASTTCASNTQSLSMVGQPLEARPVGGTHVPDVANVRAVDGSGGVVANAQGPVVSSASASSSSSPTP